MTSSERDREAREVGQRMAARIRDRAAREAADQEAEQAREAAFLARVRQPRS